jgi:DNA-binding NarL/FixJ family response regulator
MIRILLADDHAIMRRGIRGLLETHADWHVCGEAGNGREAVEMTIRLAPEVVVLDLTMPELNGLDAAKAIRAAVPATQILIFTMHESEELIRAALAAGAQAVVVKSDVEGHLLAAVEALLHHDVYFSSRVSARLLPFCEAADDKILSCLVAALARYAAGARACRIISCKGCESFENSWGAVCV